MKTPYCTAVRIQQREVDRIKVAIGAATARARGLEREGGEIVRAVAAERAVAADDWALPGNMYFARMRAERTRVEAERRAADARLDALRGEAQAAFGALKAVEGAAGRFRADVNAKRAAAEQGFADDRAAADFVQSLRQLRARRSA